MPHGMLWFTEHGSSELAFVSEVSVVSWTPGFYYLGKHVGVKCRCMNIQGLPRGSWTKKRVITEFKNRSYTFHESPTRSYASKLFELREVLFWYTSEASIRIYAQEFMEITVVEVIAENELVGRWMFFWSFCKLFQILISSKKSQGKCFRGTKSLSQATAKTHGGAPTGPTNH